MSRHPLLPVVNGLQRLYGDIQIDLDQADGRAFIEAYHRQRAQPPGSGIPGQPLSTDRRQSLVHGGDDAGGCKTGVNW